jgi:cardiolipin-specific phospholipase
LQKVQESTAYVSPDSSLLVFVSTGFTVAHILAPYAHARLPLVDRISALKIPITFVCMYRFSSVPETTSHYYLDGERDWMDPQGGLQSLENLRKAGNHHSKMYNIPYAGHHGAFFVL